MINCSAIILAGGKSSRMDYSPKALLRYKGNSFIEREIKALNDFKEIIISCNDERIKKNIRDFKVIEDKIKDIGPIGGIYSSLSEISLEKAIIVSCDMPFLNKELLNKIGKIEFEEECLIPVLEGKIEPFCGVYKKNILEKINENILNNEYALMKLIKKLNVRYIEIEIENKINFININTVEEYTDLIAEDYKNE